ncbi:MAG: hypothetical protein ACKO7N_06740, partial [Candidatus Nitrosotenuis sp.]
TMPEYSFICDSCTHKFSIFANIDQYTKLSKNKKISCDHCNSNKVSRDLIGDCSTIAGSVKKSDNELKTVGDLANRNRDRMSDDHKEALYKQHNDYKETPSDKPLPKGMTRMKKGKKVIWPS